MRLVAVVALFQVMCWVPAAHAAADQDGAKSEADKDAARSEWRQGNVAYNLGHFDEAAKHFEAAYTRVQDPAFLFNIAQSYRMGGKLEQALDLYRAFLRTTKRDTPNRETAEKFVSEIKRKLEERREAAAPPGAAPPGAATASVSLAASPSVALPIPPPVDLTSAPVAPEYIDRPFYKKWWFWTGVGVVVVAGTVTALVLAHQSSSPCSGTGLKCWEVQ